MIKHIVPVPTHLTGWLDPPASRGGQGSVVRVSQRPVLGAVEGQAEEGQVPLLPKGV